jgi:flagellar assembly protein FliH
MLETTQNGFTPATIHPLEYRAIVAAGLAPEEPEAETSEGPAAPHVAALEARIRELETELEERTRNFESGLQAARLEAGEAGRRSERGEQAARLTAAGEALTAALRDFTAGRDRYLAQVEQEVVRLALAISARILHREALMDPLLLAGAVRVALGQLADTTEVRLKVPATEHAMWSEMLRLMPNLPLHPEVISDAALMTGECLLETHLGSVDLGVRSQLAEIERGFFDLLEHRERGAVETRAQGVERRVASIAMGSSSAPGDGLDGEGSLVCQAGQSS